MINLFVLLIFYYKWIFHLKYMLSSYEKVAISGPGRNKF